MTIHMWAKSVKRIVISVADTKIIAILSDPTRPDTDSDDLSDGLERLFTDPCSRDTDQDGIQDATLGAVKTMDNDMSDRFNRLDAKYGEFGKTMKSTRKATKGMASDITVIRKEATKGRKKSVRG